MTTRILYLAFAICVLTFFASHVHAQNKRLGTAGASELLIPVGARDIAMGSSGIATSKGVEALYWNPAGVSRMPVSAEAMFSFMSHIADVDISYAAVAAAFPGLGTIGFSFKFVGFGDIPLTTEADPEGRTGRTFAPSYTTLTLGYSRALTDAISAGIGVKIISERIDLVSASGFAFDVGIQYTRLAGLKGLTFGVALKNIGPEMDFDGPGLLHDAEPATGRRPVQPLKSDAASFQLPSSLELGLAYEVPLGEKLIGIANGVFASNNLAEDTYHFGGEIGYFASEGVELYGRGGYNFAENSTITVDGVDYDSHIYGATLGAGIVYMAPGINVTIDYAWRDVEFFDANNIVSVKLGF